MSANGRRVRAADQAMPAVNHPDRDVGDTVAARVHFDLVGAIAFEAGVDAERAAEIAETCLDDVEDVVNAAVNGGDSTDA